MHTKISMNIIILGVRISEYFITDVRIGVLPIVPECIIVIFVAVPDRNRILFRRVLSASPSLTCYSTKLPLRVGLIRAL